MLYSVEFHFITLKNAKDDFSMNRFGCHYLLSQLALLIMVLGIAVDLLGCFSGWERERDTKCDKVLVGESR